MANTPYNTLKAEMIKPTTAADRSGTLENEVMPVTENVKRLRIGYLVAPAILGGLTNSTVAADGVAFPHARTELVDQIVLGIGRSAAGIPWTARGEQAHLIFLLGVPERLITDYLVVIGAIARVTKDKPLRTLLLHAETVSDFIETMLAAPSL